MGPLRILAESLKAPGPKNFRDDAGIKDQTNIDRMPRKPPWAPLGKVNTHPTASAGPADTRGGPGGKKNKRRLNGNQMQRPRNPGNTASLAQRALCT